MAISRLLVTRLTRLQVARHKFGLLASARRLDHLLAAWDEQLRLLDTTDKHAN